MASRQKLDAVGRTCGRQLILLLVLLLLAAQSLCAQGSTDAAKLAAGRRALDAQHWESAAKLGDGPADQSPELDFIRGLALAKLQRWDVAADAFTAAHRKNPGDARFLIELAGVRYKQKNFSAAKRSLRAALRLQSSDTYALEFLSTIYFVEGNFEATLKYWNRIGKPRLRSVRVQPAPKLNEVLLQRTITFNAPQLLTEDALQSTYARLDNLRIFSHQRTELAPVGETFDLTLHATERNGFGDSKLEALLSPLSGLPYATIYPEIYNLGHRAINLTSLVRWDAEKRRASAELSTPVRTDPTRRVSIYLDARNENWNLTRTFFTAAAPSDLNLRRLAGGLQLRSVAGPRWTWTTGLELASRSFRNTGAATSSSAVPFFADSTSFQYWLRADRSLFRAPEHRFTLDSSVAGSLGRFYANGLGAFGSMRGALTAHWLPRATGDDYEMRAQIRAGAAFGRMPLDELFQLGIERDDNDLSLRGHPGTAGGRKGAAPLGRRYTLLNWELDKNVYSNGIVSLKLGPFLDTGAIADSSGMLGSRQWLWDTGAQCKVRLLGSITVVLIYGRDLRGGRGNFYPTVLR